MDEAERGFLIGALVGTAYEAIGQRVTARIGAEGGEALRRGQTDVFRFLPPEGGRVTDLAAIAGTSKQAMGYIVGGLVERGYLVQEPDPEDGRAQIVRRTERGWEVNRAARRAVLEVQAEWTEILGAERMELLMDLLRDLATHLGAEYPGSIAEVSMREAG